MTPPGAELDRSEPATPHKLAEARKRGQVAKSADVVSALVFAAAVAYASAIGWPALLSQFAFDRALLAQATHGLAAPRDLWFLMDMSTRHALQLMAPFLAVLVIAAVAGNVLQTGVAFSMHPITPDWHRLDPMTGLKRVFSTRTLFETFRAVAKLVVLVWVVWESIVAMLPQFYRLAGLPAFGQAKTLVADAAELGLKMALALGVIALLDLVWTRREFAQRMRMSRRELKDEVKNREGDPRIRARLRDLRREMLKRTRALRQTRDADIVLTNPTHVAVALRYRHGEMAAPRLVAKGAGTMAAAIRAVAARHRIPVVPNPTLARALYADTAIDAEIGSGHFTQVARLMVWLIAMRQTRR